MKIRKSFIFGEARPHAACHAATLAEIPGGGFAAAWFGGTREGASDVSIWGARRGENDWSAPKIWARVAESAHWNPVLHARGDLLTLYFKVGNGVERWVTWVQHSRDAGESWGAGEPLVPGDTRGGRGPVKNKPILTSGGSLLAPASWEDEAWWRVFVDRSEDDGRTWMAGPCLEMDRAYFLTHRPGRDRGPRGVIQPTLWESSEGQLHLFMRSTCGLICRSDSRDGGHTWTPVRPTPWPNNNSGLDVARHGSGVLGMLWNPVGENWGPRTPLRFSISRDEGEHWETAADLEETPGEFSYPSLIATSAGFAGVYTWNRERIAFAEMAL